MKMLAMIPSIWKISLFIHHLLSLRDIIPDLLTLQKKTKKTLGHETDKFHEYENEIFCSYNIQRREHFPSKSESEKYHQTRYKSSNPQQIEAPETFDLSNDKMFHFITPKPMRTLPTWSKDNLKHSRESTFPSQKIYKSFIDYLYP